MATVKHFEELEVWKIARQQCADIYELIQSGAFQKNFVLIDQIDRASGSVMDCIGEGFDRFTKADFRHFLVIAKGSNAEVRSQLYRAFDRRFLQEQVFNKMLAQSLQLGVKLNNFITYLTKTGFKQKPAQNNNYYDSKNKAEETEEPAVEYEGASDYDFPGEFIAKG